MFPRQIRTDPAAVTADLDHVASWDEIEHLVQKCPAPRFKHAASTVGRSVKENFLVPVGIGYVLETVGKRQCPRLAPGQPQITPVTGNEAHGSTVFCSQGVVKGGAVGMTNLRPQRKTTA